MIQFSLIIVGPGWPAVVRQQPRWGLLRLAAVTKFTLRTQGNKADSIGGPVAPGRLGPGAWQGAIKRVRWQRPIEQGRQWAGAPTGTGGRSLAAPFT